ncbi:MAG: hypothetical protein NUV47_00765 [Patescibacteria group bacterium]|nr:hypothetical protein [Patescibacteria group bacterium]
MKKFLSNAKFSTVVLSVVVGVLLVTASLSAATTISTNITTAGTLSVTGATTLSSTLAVAGATTHSSTVAIGSSGTALTQVLKGTCTLKADQSIIATSTGSAWCAISNVTSGDIVFITLATTTTSGVGGIGAQFIVQGAQASTTATGIVDVTLLNLTGADRIPSSVLTFGSSTNYLIIR